MKLTKPPPELSEVVMCACIRKPGRTSESILRPSVEGVTFDHDLQPLNRFALSPTSLPLNPPIASTSPGRGWVHHGSTSTVLLPLIPTRTHKYPQVPIRTRCCYSLPDACTVILAVACWLWCVYIVWSLYSLESAWRCSVVLVIHLLTACLARGHLHMLY